MLASARRLEHRPEPAARNGAQAHRPARLALALGGDHRVLVAQEDRGPGEVHEGEVDAELGEGREIEEIGRDQEGDDRGRAGPAVPEHKAGARFAPTWRRRRDGTARRARPPAGRAPSAPARRAVGGPGRRLRRRVDRLLARPSRCRSPRGRHRTATTCEIADRGDAEVPQDLRAEPDLAPLALRAAASERRRPVGEASSSARRRCRRADRRGRRGPPREALQRRIDRLRAAEHVGDDVGAVQPHRHVPRRRRCGRGRGRSAARCRTASHRRSP